MAVGHEYCGRIVEPRLGSEGPEKRATRFGRGPHYLRLLPQCRAGRPSPGRKRSSRLQPPGALAQYLAMFRPDNTFKCTRLEPV